MRAAAAGEAGLCGQILQALSPEDAARKRAAHEFGEPRGSRRMECASCLLWFLRPDVPQGRPVCGGALQAQRATPPAHPVPGGRR